MSCTRGIRRGADGGAGGDDGGGCSGNRRQRLVPHPLRLRCAHAAGGTDYFDSCRDRFCSAVPCTSAPSGLPNRTPDCCPGSRARASGFPAAEASGTDPARRSDPERRQSSVVLERHGLLGSVHVRGSKALRSHVTNTYRQFVDVDKTVRFVLFLHLRMTSGPAGRSRRRGIRTIAARVVGTICTVATILVAAAVGIPRCRRRHRRQVGGHTAVVVVTIATTVTTRGG